MPHHPAADHRRQLHHRRPFGRGEQALERRLLVPLQIDQEQARHPPGQAQVDLGGEVALDQRDHRQDREAGAERDDHAGARRRPGDADWRARSGSARRRAGRAARTTRSTIRAEPGQQAGRAERHADEDQPQPAVADAREREQGQPRDAEPEQRQHRRRRPPLGRHQQRAEHRRRRDVAGPRQRPDREAERGQEPAAGGDQQRQRVEPGHHLDRQQRGGERPQQPRRREPEREAEQDAEAGQHQDLQQVDPEHQPARGAEAFEGRDGRAAGGEIVLDRERHADPADQQRGQPGERQIGREAVGEAGDPRLHVAGAAGAPARLRVDRPQPREHGLGIDPVRQRDAVGVAGERARQDGLGAGQLVEPDHRARADADIAADAVGLAQDHRADREVGRADPQPVADLRARAG